MKELFIGDNHSLLRSEGRCAGRPDTANRPGLRLDYVGVNSMYCRPDRFIDSIYWVEEEREVHHHE
jgi:hypothetical protein